MPSGGVSGKKGAFVSELVKIVLENGRRNGLRGGRVGGEEFGPKKNQKILVKVV